MKSVAPGTLLVLLFLSCLPNGWAPNAVTAAAGPMVQVRDRHLSVRVQSAPLKSLLQQVADASHIALVFFGSLDRTISLEIEEEPLEDGLKRLLTGCNFSFQYRNEKGPGGQLVPVLDRVLIISEKASLGSFRFDPAAAAEARVPLLAAPGPGPAPEPPAVYPAEMAAADTEPEESPRVGLGIFIKADKSQFDTVTADNLLAQFSGQTTSLTLGLAGAVYPSGQDNAPQDMEGVALTSVPAGGLMAQLGLQEGDVVQDINGTQTTSPDQVAEALHRAVTEGSGSPIRIEVERGDTIEPIYVEVSQSAP